MGYFQKKHLLFYVIMNYIKYMNNEVSFMSGVRRESLEEIEAEQKYFDPFEHYVGIVEKNNFVLDNIEAGIRHGWLSQEEVTEIYKIFNRYEASYGDKDDFNDEKFNQKYPNGKNQIFKFIEDSSLQINRPFFPEDKYKQLMNIFNEEQNELKKQPEQEDDYEIIRLENFNKEYVEQNKNKQDQKQPFDLRDSYKLLSKFANEKERSKSRKNELFIRCYNLLFEESKKEMPNKDQIIQVLRLGIALSLQSTSSQLSNTTTSGEKIKDMLNQESFSVIKKAIQESANLVQDNPIKYSDLRLFATSELTVPLNESGLKEHFKSKNMATNFNNITDQLASLGDYTSSRERPFRDMNSPIIKKLNAIRNQSLQDPDKNKQSSTKETTKKIKIPIPPRKRSPLSNNEPGMEMAEIKEKEEQKSITNTDSTKVEENRSPSPSSHRKISTHVSKSLLASRTSNGIEKDDAVKNETEMVNLQKAKLDKNKR